MSFLAVMPVALALFVAIHYYIGLRGWQWLNSTGVRPSRLVYWTLFCLLALSLVASRMVPKSVPLWVAGLLAQISGYWMAVFVYALLLLLLIDLVRLLNRWLGFIPSRWNQGGRLTRAIGAAVLLVLLMLMLYGTWRARTPVVTEYTVNIPKAAGQLHDLHVVMFSDTHLGYIFGNSRVQQLVQTVNGLKPDVILVAGDITDGDMRPILAENMLATLNQMKAKLGTYGVLGNHDPRGADLPAFRAEMAQAGIHLLVDEAVQVDDSFYVAGRSDNSQSRRQGAQAGLGQILAGVNPARPILLMDHQPNRLADAQAAGVDLQVSGHTHQGQIFPGNLITKRIYEVDWGHLTRAATHFIVSDGFGTWGPPIRIGNRPEVVSIRITFGQ
ncbi:MAG: metallophosphoesterase [Mycobacterium leprae]